MTPRICFIIPGPPIWASSRLRASWLLPYLPGSVMSEHKAGAAVPDADVYIWIKAIDHEVVQATPNARHYWDQCDPSWWFEPAGARQNLAVVQATVCSCAPLADDLRANGATGRIEVIPDRLDLAHYPLKRTQQRVDVVRLIWFGAFQNRLSLFAALPYLERLAASGVRIELSIVDDHPETDWGLTDKFPTYHHRWSLGLENQLYASHDLAILPPYPGPWGKVKTNNKALTAWACGLAVTDCQDWGELLDLATLSSNRKDDAAAGLELVQTQYRIEQSAAQWLELIG